MSEEEPTKYPKLPKEYEDPIYKGEDSPHKEPEVTPKIVNGTTETKEDDK